MQNEDRKPLSTVMVDGILGARPLAANGVIREAQAQSMLTAARNPATIRQLPASEQRASRRDPRHLIVAGSLETPESERGLRRQEFSRRNH